MRHGESAGEDRALSFILGVFSWQDFEDAAAQFSLATQHFHSPDDGWLSLAGKPGVIVSSLNPVSLIQSLHVVRPVERRWIYIRSVGVSVQQQWSQSAWRSTAPGLS